MDSPRPFRTIGSPSAALIPDETSKKGEQNVATRSDCILAERRAIGHLNFDAT
jgi:hypothetical protein